MTFARFRILRERIGLTSGFYPYFLAKGGKVQRAVERPSSLLG
jgi:hypothetical protein